MFFQCMCIVCAAISRCTESAIAAAVEPISAELKYNGCRVLMAHSLIKQLHFQLVSLSLFFKHFALTCAAQLSSRLQEMRLIFVSQFFTLFGIL